tara:strand:- start:47 stop:388 length:342 start_codon:yes stop_codon:yes gene_type:complete
MTNAEALTEIANHLTSPNVRDANWEQANITDAVAKIAFAIFAHAEAMEKLADAIGGEDGLNTQVNGVGLRVEAIAERIEALRNSGLDISTGNLGEVAEALDRISDFMPGKNGK